MNNILATISILFAVSFLFSKPWKSYMNFFAKLSDKTVRYSAIVFLASSLLLHHFKRANCAPLIITVANPILKS